MMITQWGGGQGQLARAAARACIVATYKVDAEAQVAVAGGAAWVRRPQVAPQTPVLVLAQMVRHLLPGLHGSSDTTFGASVQSVAHVMCGK